MKVNILFFAGLADKTGCSSIDMENINNLDELRRNLRTMFPFLEKASYAIAVNQTVVKGNIQLNNNDEIALLPPFAGG